MVCCSCQRNGLGLPGVTRSLPVFPLQGPAEEEQVPVEEEQVPVDPDDLAGFTDPIPEYKKGTTTLGFIFNNEGIMVAVDHSWTPSDRLPPNVLKINPHILVAFSGGSNYSRIFLLHRLEHECSMFKHIKKTELSAIDVVTIISTFLTHCPESDNALGILVAGWDSIYGPSLYKINGKGEYFSDSSEGTGSGSGGGRVIIISRLSRFCWHFTEAIEIAQCALCLGVYRARESLECVSIFHVGKDGITAEVSNGDIQKWQKMHFVKTGMEWVDPATRTWPWPLGELDCEL